MTKTATNRNSALSTARCPTCHRSQKCSVDDQGKRTFPSHRSGSQTCSQPTR